MAVVARLFEQSRFSGILLFLLINLGGSALLRTALLIRQLADLDVSFYSIALVFLLGVVNDLAFFSYLMIPFALYLLVLPNAAYQSKLNRILVFAGFFVSLYGLFFVEMAEWTFWDEFGVRFNFIAVDYLIYTHEVVRNIIESYPLGKILSGIFIVTAACFLAMRKLLAKSFKASEPFLSRLKITAALLSLPLISYVGVGQSAHQFSANTYLNELAANGPYQFFAAFRNNELDYRHFYKLGDDRQLSGVIRAKLAANAHSSDKELYNIRRTIKHAGEEKHLNVILITVESLSAEFLTRFGNTEHITPFMDEWFEQGLLFTNFYATGTRTVRGLEALTLSIPPTPGQSIVKRPDNGNLFNLGHVFQQRGYDTAFLYGGRGYFDNMNAFFAGNGYRIIDQTDFTDEEVTFSNAWGVSDDIILKRTLKEADRDYQNRRPFFFQIMTTSNHRPYTYPEGKIDIPPGIGRTGGVKYTDYALREFIGLAKTRPWFDDTLFVVVADHCAGSASKVDLPVDRYHIPLFIYAPKHVPAKRNDILSSQIDVAPTILGLLNFSYESQFYGRDLMRLPKDEGRALISNYQKLGLVKNNKLVYLSPQQRIDVIEDPLGAHRPVEIGSAVRLIEEEMAYYQSADYIWSHRLNRYQ
ncbi:LTA synthase family protein [Methylobacter marinus]|uniref:LTA synthase family protein n=1 Tax=Methylobacter marinus TaxID=34058 RepID=UPI0003657264|nr:LTA synthase family protein [Methylobacter marinus]